MRRRAKKSEGLAVVRVHLRDRRSSFVHAEGARTAEGTHTNSKESMDVARNSSSRIFVAVVKLRAVDVVKLCAVDVVKLCAVDVVKLCAVDLGWSVSRSVDRSIDSAMSKGVHIFWR